MKSHRRNVLIVDGHEDVLITLARLLEDNGLSTVTTRSAKEALQMIDAVGFDLILVNEYLPDADAEDLLRQLSHRDVESPCMVMHPGAPQMLEVRKFRMLGAANVICKRNHRALLDAVQELMSTRTNTTKTARISK